MIYTCVLDSVPGWYVVRDVAHYKGPDIMWAPPLGFLPAVDGFESDRGQCRCPASERGWGPPTTTRLDNSKVRHSGMFETRRCPTCHKTSIRRLTGTLAIHYEVRTMRATVQSAGMPLSQPLLSRKCFECTDILHPAGLISPTLRE